jgi:colanic acid biosynthesis glycosyl transferase WcaI
MAGPRSIVFLNRFYWPDVAATGQMLADLAEDLAASGWGVTVVTSAALYEGKGDALPRAEQHRGVHIVRVAGTRFGRHRLLGRLADYASYMAGALRHLLRLPRPDVVVAMSDPPFIVAVALLAARLRGARAVYWVQDLFPQIAAKLGVMREASLSYRAARALARWIHARCDLVIGLGPQMARALVSAGAPPGRTTFVHNWADAEAVRPLPPERNEFLRQHGLAERFVVLYSGNAGRAHPFEAVMHAARALRDDPTVCFVFIGGGKKLPELRALAQADGLANVRFLDYLPRERLSESLSAASVSLVTEDPDVVGLLVPSKTYGILASGRPLLFVGSAESDVAAVVRDADCGVVIAPDDREGLVAAIRGLRADPVTRARLGANARRAAEERYARRHATAHWARVVGTLVPVQESGALPTVAGSIAGPPVQ